MLKTWWAEQLRTVGQTMNPSAIWVLIFLSIEVSRQHATRSEIETLLLMCCRTGSFKHQTMISSRIALLSTDVSSSQATSNLTLPVTTSLRSSAKLVARAPSKLIWTTTTIMDSKASASSVFCKSARTPQAPTTWPCLASRCTATFKTRETDLLICLHNF